MAYAHSRNDRRERQDLVAHLRGVAELAANFAAAFGARELGYWAGLWHDIGKFDPAWQEYLLRSEADVATRRDRTDHKGAGTLLATQYLGTLGLLVHGHHGGLRNQTDFRRFLQERRQDRAVAEAIALARQAIADLEPTPAPPLPDHMRRDPRAAELFMRMLFSALVDADSLDTERHASEEHARLRGVDVALATLWERFESDQQRLLAGPDSPVNHIRREIYRQCLEAAELPPGFFRLTVPTGGGKTLSGMGFALRHALRHGLKRVVVAVPFLTITDQTAKTYHDIFEDDNDERPVVLEHHSMADQDVGDDDEEDFAPHAVWARLTAENWDAPVIVTTTVQLFESLFARNRTRTRKLHRLAQSVIIIDEAQTLPPHLLQPILDVLKELCTNYGTTVVISTATQPAFESIEVFRDVRAVEIVPDPEPLFEQLSRVAYEWRIDQPLAWPEVADLMRDEPQALAVLNTKKDALALLDVLGDPDAFHLSTLLCGAHRREVVAEVRRRLATGAPCRLVATQVVEAGVDLDFPLVLRALGPLDSIIQAAGRCNREGRLAQGRVIVFEPEGGGMPPGAYRVGASETRTLLLEAAVDRGLLDPDDPSVSRRYFQRLFQGVDTDAKAIQTVRERLDYPEVARRFRMIDDDTESVVVMSYGSDEEQSRVRDLVERLRAGGPDGRFILRRLQPCMVNVRRYQADRYRRDGWIVPVRDGIGEWCGQYDPLRGLVTADPDPDSLVI